VIFVHSFSVEFGSKYHLVLCTGIQFIVCNSRFSLTSSASASVRPGLDSSIWYSLVAQWLAQISRSARCAPGIQFELTLKTAPRLHLAQDFCSRRSFSSGAVPAQGFAHYRSRLHLYTQRDLIFLLGFSAAGQNRVFLLLSCVC
jgi:hypothetical protein